MSASDLQFHGAYTRYSSWTARLALILEYFSIPHTSIVYNIFSIPPPLRPSASSLFPALTVRALNTTLHDSLAISEYLAEAFPHLHLWPQNTKLRALARCAANEMHAGFGELRNTYHSNFVARYPSTTVSPQARKELARFVQIVTDARAVTKEAGDVEGGFLFGAFSIADAMFYPVLWRVRTYQLPLPGAGREVREWIETLWNAEGTRRFEESVWRQWDDVDVREESRIAKYDNVFGEGEEVRMGAFEKGWTWAEYWRSMEEKGEAEKLE